MLPTYLAYAGLALAAVAVLILEWRRERRAIDSDMALGPLPAPIEEDPKLAENRLAAIQYVTENNLEPCYSAQYRRRRARAERERKKRYAEIAARAKEKADAAREYTQTLREWELDSERIS